MISLIIPCFNEEESLPLFYPEATSVLQKMNCDYELIFVNDGSRDRTLAILKELSEKDSHVIYLSFSRNFGKEAAMYAGFCNARGDYVAVMDADLQDPPSLLPEMLEKLESGEYDSVATRRVSRDGEPPIRSFFARKFYQLINKISDADIVDGARDFRLMKRSMVDAIVSMSEYNRFSKGIFGWIGFKTLWLPYKNIERVAGETKWNFWKLFKYAISGIINFSQAPLTIASWFGTSMTGVSFLALIVIVLRKLIFDDPVDGWASIICVIIFIGGLQLFCLGIMGQYIAKTYMEVKNRPHYIIAESNKKDFISFLFHLDLKQSGCFFLRHLHCKISIFDLIFAHLFFRIDYGYLTDLLCVFQRDHRFCCSRCPYRKIGILLCFYSVSENFRLQSTEAQREERHTVTDFLTDLFIQGDSLFHTVHGILAKLPYHTADIRAKEHTVYHIVDHMLFFILIRIYPHATLLRGNRTCHIGCNIGIVEIIGLVTGGLQA